MLIVREMPGMVLPLPELPCITTGCDLLKKGGGGRGGRNRGEKEREGERGRKERGVKQW